MRVVDVIGAVLASAIESYGGGLLIRAGKRLFKAQLLPGGSLSRARWRSSILDVPAPSRRLSVGHLTRRLRTPPRKGSRNGTLVIQRHDARNLHHDVSIIDSDGRELFRGARSSKQVEDMFPKPGQRRQWIQQPEHSSEYSLETEQLNIPEGQYGTGVVTKALQLPVEIVKSRKDQINFNVYDNGYRGRYALIHTKGDKWIVVVKNESLSLLPKHNYTTEDESFLSTPGIYDQKVDGAYMHALLTDKGNKLWSWRQSKKTGDTIQHQDRLPKFRDEIHNEFHNTKLSGELVQVERLRSTVGRGLLSIPRLRQDVYLPAGAERPSWLAGRLNSSEWKAREAFDRDKGKTTLVLFDVEKFKGKDVKGLPYGQKIGMMDELAREYSFIQTPRRFTDGNKAWRVLVESEGREGLVYKDPAKPAAYPDTGLRHVKIKATDFTDAKVLDMHPVVRRTGITDNSRMGALVVKSGKSEFEVGTGFSDFERQWFMSNKDKVIQDGSWIKVKHNPKTEDRLSPHGGVYSGVHGGKTEGVLSELSLDDYTNGDRDLKYAIKTSQGWKP